MQPGEVWVRTSERQRDPRGMNTEPIGTAIEIEEAPLPQLGHVDHARAVFRNGPREGEKVQWAIRYIEETHRLETP